MRSRTRICTSLRVEPGGAEGTGNEGDAESYEWLQQCETSQSDDDAMRGL